MSKRGKTTAAAGSALFFAVAPGVVAGLVPWWLTGWRVQKPPVPYPAVVRVMGVVLAGAGALALVHSFARFVGEGIGTPAPVAPTQRLVVGGLYRYVRNPMYLAVVAAIAGQALAFGQLALLLYAGTVGALTAAFVRWYEEPALRRQFGPEYEEYRRAVPAWRPRRRSWTPVERRGLTPGRKRTDEVFGWRRDA